MKLQNRLMLTLTGVTATVLGLSLATLHVLVQRDEVAALDEALFRQASAAAQKVQAEGASSPLAEGGVEVPESLTPTARFLVLFDAKGRPLAASKAFADDAPSLEELGVTELEALPWEGIPLDVQVGDDALRGVVVPVGNDGKSLLFAASRRSVTEDIRFLTRALTVLFACAMVVTALLARWFGRILAEDVRTIASVARAVTHGELNARVGERARRSLETRSLARDLDDMIHRLSELVRSQQSFVSHAAHELRSPLSTLRGELQLALRKPREPEEYRRALEMALDDVEGLSKLAEDLLALARIQAKADLALNESASAEELVHEAIKMTRGLAEAHKVTLKVQPFAKGAGEIRVRGPRAELSRVLRNLVENAIHHGVDGGTVHIEGRRTNGHVEIAVRDEGRGIAEAEREHIFTPFVRGAQSQQRNHEGAGLGLAIARGIAREYGGDVELDMSHTQGARFVVRLPLAPAGPS